MAVTIVISEWHVDLEPNSQGEYVAIRGRASGVLSWIQSILGVDRGIRMVVTKHHIRFQQGDLGGSSTRIIPLENICSTYYGFARPWFATLLVITLSLILSYFWFKGQVTDENRLYLKILAVGWSFLIGGIYYLLNQRMTIGFVEHSGEMVKLVFKQSALEGIKLNEQTSAQACDIIQWLMDGARNGSLGPLTSTTQQGFI